MPPASRSLRRDISTLISEEVVIFTGAETPHFRETKKKREGTR